MTPKTIHDKPIRLNFPFFLSDSGKHPEADHAEPGSNSKKVNDFQSL